MWNLKLKIQYCLQLLKKLKYFDVNLARHMQDSYAQNHQTAMKEIKGNYTDLTFKGYYDAHPELKDSYLHITLTDEEDVPDAAAKLRVIYPLLMKLDYDNTRTRNQQRVTALSEVEKKTPMELFDAFFEMQNGQTMSAEQKQYVETLIEKIWEGDK